MSKQENTTLLRVGIFMAIGLSVIAAMVVYFGRFGDAVRGYYDLRAEFPDASGIYTFASLTGGPHTVRIPSTPTYFEVVGGGADQQLTQGPSPTVGVSAAVQPGTTVTCSPP